MKNIKKHIVKSFAVLFSAITLLTTTNSLTSLAVLPDGYLEKLFSAIDEGNKTEVVNLIEEIKKDSPQDVKELVNSYNESGNNPLSFAAKKKQTEIAQILLENGADVNAGSTNHGTTPIMYAVMGKNDDLFKMLLEKGADITISDKLGHNLFMFATNYSNNTAINFILQKAKEIYKDKPLELNKFINSRDNNYDKISSTSLMLAVVSGNLSAIKAVLESGADIEAKNKLGQNALIFATGIKRLDHEISVTIIETLLKNLKNKYPNGPEKIINYILDKDKKGNNAIDYAKHYNNPKAVVMLEEVSREGYNASLFKDNCYAKKNNPTINYNFNHSIDKDKSESNLLLIPNFNFGHK